jgi:hypothetical protein
MDLLDIQINSSLDDGCMIILGRHRNKIMISYRVSEHEPSLSFYCFCALSHGVPFGVALLDLHFKQTSKQANKQTSKQTSKQANERTSELAN